MFPNLRMPLGGDGRRWRGKRVWTAAKRAMLNGRGLISITNPKTTAKRLLLLQASFTTAAKGEPLASASRWQGYFLQH